MADIQDDRCNLNQYKDFCKPRFDNTDMVNAAIFAKLDLIHKKLFEDNGTECLQSKINRHDGWIARFDSKLIIVLTGLLGSGGLAGLIVWIIKSYSQANP